jgi:uncharacterized DUF497 family protein
MAESKGFDWDTANVAHIARHGVEPAQVEQALSNDPVNLSYVVAGSGEQRWASVGPTDDGRLLVVVWTVRGDRVRVVTAYPATKRVRAAYASAKGGSHGETDPEVQQ